MKRTRRIVWAIALCACAGPAHFAAYAQARKAPKDTMPERSDTSAAGGANDPGKGFSLVKTEHGTVGVSIYALYRYINQLPPTQTYRDHLGNLHGIDTRNDIQWHRILLTFDGWLYLPKLGYSVTLWTVNATTQVAIVGAMTYDIVKQFNIGGGINSLPGTRTLLGSHPYWLGTDRFMADEYFRPGFTAGVWATGELLPRLFYRAMLGNSITQLGISAAQLTRNMATSASIWWLPTTGEFGPRGGFGDYEYHEQIAVRLGTSYTHSHENRFAQSTVASPDNAQIRLSDAVLLFQTGALAAGVTINDATYQLNAFDLGFKYRGAALQTEIYIRRLNRFNADGPLPQPYIYDSGWLLTGAYMVIPKRLELFAATSQINGQFNRSWEGVGGLNWFPADTRNLRVNLYVTGVHRSPTASLFGYYAGGLRGTIIGVSASVFY